MYWYILFVHHALFLSSNTLEISIKHSFTSFDSRLLYLASAYFLSLPFDFFHFRLIFFYVGWLSFAFRLRFSTTHFI